MENLQAQIGRLAHTPGVYLYRDQTGCVLYVGKAKDLRKRVSQYWVRDAVGAKTKLLVSQISHIQTIPTASEFDALLLEAKLIHDLRPKYNVVLKDDKSPLYILLTCSETLPHVTCVRFRDLPKNLKKADALFGPFASARIVRSLLRQLRRSVPFCTQKRRTGRACFYTHLDLCAPCPSAIVGMPAGKPRAGMVHEYRTNIFRLKQILSGKSGRVIRDLTRHMQAKAGARQYEEAAKIRDHIRHLHLLLQKSYDPMLYVSSDMAVENIYAQELSALVQSLSPYLTVTSLARIECIDISNIGGINAAGSLVVLTNGFSDSGQYRRFRIRRNPPAGGPNDVAMIAEVMTRRFSHPEWPYPNLLVIDGGKPQVTAARKALAAILSDPERSGGRVEGSPLQSLPIIGLAKRFEELIIPIPGNRWKILRLAPTSPGLRVVTRIRDEAHRFALSYHRLLRSRGFDTMKLS